MRGNLGHEANRLCVLLSTLLSYRVSFRSADTLFLSFHRLLSSSSDYPLPRPTTSFLDRLSSSSTGYPLPSPTTTFLRPVPSSSTELSSFTDYPISSSEYSLPRPTILFLHRLPSSSTSYPLSPPSLFLSRRFPSSRGHHKVISRIRQPYICRRRDQETS